MYDIKISYVLTVDIFYHIYFFLLDINMGALIGQIIQQQIQHFKEPNSINKK